MIGPPGAQMRDWSVHTMPSRAGSFGTGTATVKVPFGSVLPENHSTKFDGLNTST